MQLTGEAVTDDNKAANIVGTCTSCHDAGNAGNHSVPAPLDARKPIWSQCPASMTRNFPSGLRAAISAMPPVMAESPITAIAWRGLPWIFAAAAMPNAAEMLVVECAVPNASYSLSLRFGKPDRPPN